MGAAIGHPPRSPRWGLPLDGGNTIHIDLWVSAGESLESEVERLLALGASRVEWEQESAQHVVLADREGNLFCVERLLALGASRVEWDQESAQHVVLADQEGNLFCVRA